MLSKRNPQLNKNGELIHLLSTEGLSKNILTHILDTAERFVSVNDREVKRCPSCVASLSLICFLKTPPARALLLKLPPSVCRLMC